MERMRMGWVEEGRRRYSGAGIRAIVHIRAQLAAADGEAAPGQCALHRARRDGLTRIFSGKGCEASKVVSKLMPIDCRALSCTAFAAAATAATKRRSTALDCRCRSRFN